MERDRIFMMEAYDVAKLAYSRGQLPIGAALVIDGKLIGTNNNSQVENENWSNHAENILIQNNGALIKKSSKDKKV